MHIYNSFGGIGILFNYVRLISSQVVWLLLYIQLLQFYAVRIKYVYMYVCIVCSCQQDLKYMYEKETRFECPSNSML